MTDRLLRELGDLARSETEAEKARFDERWDRLAAGTLTAEEEAELKALADSSPEDREAYEAFRPLGADFQARVVSAIRPRILPFRPVMRRAEVWVGLAAAVAAGVFFLVQTPSLPPLPAYEANLSGGAQPYRGGEPVPTSGLQVFVPDSPLTLTVTPSTAVQDVEARALLSPLSGKGDVLPLEPKARLEITDQGAVRLQGTLGQEIQLSPGDWRIWIVVGRKGRIPSVKEIQTELRAGRARHVDWQAVAKDLRVAARASP